jgi:hypothetical protein
VLIFDIFRIALLKRTLDCRGERFEGVIGLLRAFSLLDTRHSIVPNAGRRCMLCSS